MIKRCPRCQQERSVGETICEGTFKDEPCHWDLMNVRPSFAAQLPPEATTGDAPPQTETPPQSPLPATCPNGHLASPGDFLCSECGEEIIESASDSVVAEAATPLAPAEPLPSVDEWQATAELSGSATAHQRYFAQNLSGREGVLTLYDVGAQPDPEVYAVLQRMDHDHVPTVLAFGHHGDQAFDVVERLDGGQWNALVITTETPDLIQRAVDEIGRALRDFKQVGLRHRDLRPDSILIRNDDPLDLVISGFGSARLSAFDLDVVSPLETSLYMAPEAIVGGVAAASDWWSLGMLLLEKLTDGACFEGINPKAFLIHVLTHGVDIPEGLPGDQTRLLQGLLARDRNQRWQWEEVEKWLNGEEVLAPQALGIREEETPAISLGDKEYRRISDYTLAAAERDNWQTAKDQLLRGQLVQWMTDAGCSDSTLSFVRALLARPLDDDLRLGLALKALNPQMPLVLEGDLVTPGWLLENPEAGIRLLEGEGPELLSGLEDSPWLLPLKKRAERIRLRAQQNEIELDEDALRVLLLSTSTAKLAAEWQAKRRILPDTEQRGLSVVVDRPYPDDRDLILLIAAEPHQFRSIGAVINAAKKAANTNKIESFDEEAARYLLSECHRSQVFALVAERIENFARCGHQTIDEWCDQFRLERRMPLEHALVVLAVEESQWIVPPRHEYIHELLSFFEQRVALGIRRGALARMTIGKTSTNIDLMETGTERRTTSSTLDRILLRSGKATDIDPAAFAENPELERRLRRLEDRARLHKRETGVDGLYLGFPFLLFQPPSRTIKPRIAPVLLWPIKVNAEVGRRGLIKVAFDTDREEVRLNPALESYLGSEVADKWLAAAQDLLQRELRSEDVIDALGLLAPPDGREVMPLPPKDATVEDGPGRLIPAAVLFHAAFMGQSVIEDLRKLKSIKPETTALASMLRLTEPPPAAVAQSKESHAEDSEDDSAAAGEGIPIVAEADKHLTVASDPSQESSVWRARHHPGLVIEGPPGTGKSQTIVNIVSDTIGMKQTLLLVCQKQAALEVVHKRLESVGLGKRVALVTDINKDRRPIIKDVREQVEILLNRPSGTAIGEDRQRIAERITEIEAEADGYHEALHQVDNSTGKSYRDLVSALVDLEQGEIPPVQCPEVRPLGASIKETDLERIQAELRPLFPLWAAAEFEQSPLAALREINSDANTLQRFEQDLQDFASTEAEREALRQARSTKLHLETSAETQTWLREEAPALSNLSDEQIAEFGHWIDRFAPDEEGQSPAAQAQQQLTAMQAGLDQLGLSAEAADFTEALMALPDDFLESWAQTAEKATRPVGFFGSLSPSRFFAKRKLRAFVRECGEEPTERKCIDFLSAARAETTLRPYRTTTRAMARDLEVTIEPEAPITSMELRAASRRLLDAIQAKAPLARAVRVSSAPESLTHAIKRGHSEAIQQVIADLEHACQLADARSLSLQQTDGLRSWFEDAWVDDVRGAIAAGAPLQTKIEQTLSALPTVEAFLQWRRRIPSVSEPALSILNALSHSREAFKDLQPDDEQLADELLRTISRELLLEAKTRVEADLRALDREPAELAVIVEELARLDRELREVNQDVLIGGIDVSQIGSRSKWEDITRLQGKRLKSLREFFEKGSDLGLLHLRPVWLMNPDVASRLLPLKQGLFDVVIYDEASQMPVEYSLPTLYRGSRAIVSGDEKQLPPTSFFGSRMEESQDEDEETLELDDDAAELRWHREEIKDATDLLNLARSTLPHAMLEIHYRSLFRELIAFSNAAFYGNRLNIPAQRPDVEIVASKPLEVIRVDGLYEQQTNPQEAERVVEILQEAWTPPYSDRPSIGVVTFNGKQAALIKQELERKAEEDEEFRRAYSQELDREEDGEDMGFFVKNVENVQGDERDIIVFSTTFGRNEYGKFRRNFGVLGQRGGERRLNVAITRARQKVILATSMPVHEISDFLMSQRAPAIARDYLQAYLAYAERISNGDLREAASLLQQVHGKVPQHRETALEAASGFNETVGKFIRTLGFDPISVRDDTAFQLDFAIVDPSTGRFGIGIECDTPNHPILKRARAREIWRPAVLRRSVPVVHRVSSYSWYHNRSSEQARLKEAIAAAIKRQPDTEEGA